MLGLRHIGKNTAVPLKEIAVKVTIKGFIANVESSLLYENEEEEAIETEFVFPVDDRSAVYRFEAKIEDRTIIAECQDKDKAQETYKDAIATGHTAMMLSEDDSAGDIFQMKLGNLPPQKEARLTFCYVLELALEPEGLMTYTLPTVLNPRYQPQDGPSSLSNHGNTIQYSNCEYKFSFSARIQGQQVIKSITSTKDNLNITMDTDKKSATVVLADKFAFDHDLCLDIEYEDPSTPTVIVERGIPEARSMGSDRMKKASETLLLLLKSLPLACSFNVVSFGSTHSSLFKRVFTFGIGSGASTALINKVAKATGEKATFVKDQERLQGKVMSVLKCALQPAVTDVVLDWKLPQGISVLSIPTEVPPLFNGEKFILYGILNQVPEANETSSVTIKGKTDSGEMFQSVTFSLFEDSQSIDDSAPVHRLAAKAQIKELEINEQGYYSSNKEKITVVSIAANIVSKYTAFVGVDSESKLPVEGQQIQPDVYEEEFLMCGLMDTSLSMNYHSLALDLDDHQYCFKSASHMKRKSAGFFSMPKFPNVFGGLKNLFARKTKSKPAKSAPAASASAKAYGEDFEDCDFDEMNSELDCKHSQEPETTDIGASATGKSGGMLQLIELQQFNGSWNLTSKLASILGQDLGYFQKRNLCESEELWATVLSLAFLRVKFMNRKDEWEMIEQKALAWLTKQDMKGKGEEELIDEAKKIIL